MTIPSTVSNEDLLEMLERIEAEEVDDSEEILDWFAMKGPSLIRELLQFRGVSLNAINSDES